MYGAILGDMIGAPYEFDMGKKTKEFPLFCTESRYTDDSVMTVAVAEALLDYQFREDEDIKAGLVESMRQWGKKYPNAGYGARFCRWLTARKPEPYGSCGNGSAMRVSSVGWLFDRPSRRPSPRAWPSTRSSPASRQSPSSRCGSRTSRGRRPSCRRSSVSRDDPPPRNRR